MLPTGGLVVASKVGFQKRRALIAPRGDRMLAAARSASTLRSDREPDTASRLCRFWVARADGSGRDRVVAGIE